MHDLTDVNNIKISYQPFQKNLSNSQILNSGVGERSCREGGEGVGDNRGDCGTSVRVSISKPTPFIYLAFENTDPFIY